MAHMLDAHQFAMLQAAVVDRPLWQTEVGDRNGTSQHKPREDVKVHDFRRAAAFSRDLNEEITRVHERFAREWALSLSELLRVSVEMRVAEVEQRTFGQFATPRPAGTFLSLLESDSFQSPLWFEVSPAIAFPIINRMLGGSDAELFVPQRPMTQIEARLMGRVAERCALHLSAAWHGRRTISFRPSDLQDVRRQPPRITREDPALIVGFQVRMGACAGRMALCIPLQATTALPSPRNDPASGSERARRMRAALVKSVERTVVDVRARLSRARLTREELHLLQPGDIVTTAALVVNPIELEVAGQAKFAATYGRFRGRKAARIARVQTPPHLALRSL